jgi:two-component system KDP operon response regulator KdpE
VETESFTLNLATKQVTRRGMTVSLTPTEWNILELLARNRGALVTHEELLTTVWGPAYANETSYLRVYLAQLRRKLETDPANPRHLLTETGLGYRFKE